MITSKYCKKCQKKTDHRHVRVSGLGDENEGAVKRLFIGAVTLGISEVFADHYLECAECGRTA